VEPKKTNGIASNMTIAISLLPDKKFRSNSNINYSLFKNVTMIHKKRVLMHPFLKH